MPSFFVSVAVPVLALAGSTFANPFKRGNDACLAAVTGKAALGDDSLRSSHCASFIKTVVTPPAITVTTTVTDTPESTGWANYKRAVTVCPNEVPNYASACDEPGYKSACSVFGISTGETTFTIPATTTTKTVYQGTGGTGTCKNGTSTVTSTVTSAKATVTSTVTLTGSSSGGHPGGSGNNTATSTITVTKNAVTVTVTNTASYTGGLGNHTVTSTITKDAVTVTVTGTSPAGTSGSYSNSTQGNGKCISQAKADSLVSGFINLLEYTSYPGSNYTTPPTPAGRGYNQNVSDATLDTNFQDYSDSINWMAGFPLGGITFPSKAAFDQGQGYGQPEVSVETLNTWYSCNTITWRYRITTVTQAKIQGLNQFVVSDEGKLITNYAEFDNGAWLSSFGLSCKVPSSP